MQNSPLDAPILRLNSDIWSSLGAFTSPNELIKLSMLSPLLRDRIKQGTRSLHLCWTSYHYIDVSTVLHVINQYPHVSEVSFTSQDNIKPHWTPVDWSRLPTQLTSLSLCFADSVCSFFGNPVLIGDLLPCLRVSEDVVSPSVHLPPLLRLRGLPPHLLHLHISSYRPLSTPYSDFNELPTGLETLALDLKLGFVADESDGFSPITVKMHAPRFPPHLKSLSYGHCNGFLHLDLSTLPQTLESLDFRAFPMMCAPFDTPLGGSTLAGS